ncbi:MAG: hypothetical protein ACE5E8_12325 [Acidimicrobiia bacterium]
MPAKEMSAVTGGGGIVVVAGAGHMASMEEPGVVNEALRGFWTKDSAAGG